MCLVNNNIRPASDIICMCHKHNLYNTLFQKTCGSLIALTTTSDNGLLDSLSTILPEIDLSQGFWDCISSDKNRNKYIIQQDLITVLYELYLWHIHMMSLAGLILLLTKHIKINDWHSLKY